MPGDAYIIKDGSVVKVSEKHGQHRETLTDADAMELAERLIEAKRAGFQHGCTCCGEGLRTLADGTVANCAHCDERCWPDAKAKANDT